MVHHLGVEFLILAEQVDAQLRQSGVVGGGVVWYGHHTVVWCGVVSSYLMRSSSFLEGGSTTSPIMSSGGRGGQSMGWSEQQHSYVIREFFAIILKVKTHFTK